MKELINQESIVSLKKSRKYIFISIIISLVVFAAIVVPLFFLVNRNTKYIFNVILTVLSTAEASFVLYMLAVCLFPLNHYIKIGSLAMNGNKFASNGRVKDLPNKIVHYRGVAVKEITVIDIEEGKEYIFYVEQNCKEEFVTERVYKFVTYQSFIISYDENI